MGGDDGAPKPVVCALLVVVFMIIMPAVDLVLAIWGLSTYTVEKDVYNIWSPTSGHYWDMQQYAARVQPTAGTSSLLMGLSFRKDYGEHMTKESLMDVVDRLNKTERDSVVTVDGNTYTMQDLCLVSGEDYVMPCFRFTIVDGFLEGGYMWDTAANTGWYQVAVDSLFKGMVLDGAMAANPQACAVPCEFGPDKVSSATAALGYLMSLSAVYESPCATCIRVALNGTYRQLIGAGAFQANDLDGIRDYLYFAGIRSFLPAIDPNFALLLDGQPDAAVQGILDVALIEPQLGLRKGVSNPYNWQLGTNLQPRGFPRPSINTDVTENHKVASDKIWWYDEGATVPHMTLDLIAGGTTPGVQDVSPTNQLSEVVALEHLWPLSRPAELQKKLRNPRRPGGPINLTLDEAAKVLGEFKTKSEAVYSKGWDDPNDPSPNRYLAFTDDAGAGGSFSRALDDLTRDSIGLSILAFGLTALVSIVFLTSPTDCVESSIVVGFVGTVLAVISFGGALGLTALIDVNFNVVQTWTLPFLMVGVGVDDMYVITLSVKKYGHADFDSFRKAWRNFFVPVTMTSVVNAGMFAMMLQSNLAAVYETAKTGLFAVGLLYLTMVTSFPAYLYADRMRQRNYRKDIVCCIKGAEKEFKVSNNLYQLGYKKIAGLLPVQVLVVIVSLVLVGLSGYGISKTVIGVDLNDFFPDTSQPGQWTTIRQDYFPIWPVNMWLGALEYKDPDLQMRLARIFEDLGKIPYIGALPADNVWTARYAQWGLPTCTAGTLRCGWDYGCVSTWVENTHGLSLNTATPPGICQLGSTISYPGMTFDATKEYCPVFQGQTDEQLKFCVSKWQEFTRDDDLLQPGLNVEADGYTPEVPIRISKVGGSLLFAGKMVDTDAYIDMIESTRKVCDESGIACWMGGIPYNYWEQYLDIKEFMAQICISALAVGFLLSFLLMFFDFVVNGDSEASILRKICVGFVGATLITFITTLSMYTCFGMSALLDVKLSVFSIMSYLISVGFAVEYSVHVVHRYLEAPKDLTDPNDRVEYAMEFLFLPTFMAFLSSVCGIICMGFTDVPFVLTYFFTPMVLVVIVTYFYGCFLLPTILRYLSCSFLYMGVEQAGSDETGKGDARAEPTTPITMGNPAQGMSL